VKRPLRSEELRLWRAIAATVHPLPGRAVPAEAAPPPATAVKVADPPARVPIPQAKAKPAQPVGPPPLEYIEPGRRRRIARERDPIGGRIDLHGMDQDRARFALESFLRRAWDEGYRAVLVITGKGSRGDGVLRRRAPEWLATGAMREIVAGISEAERRHGGEGALYVALKRKPRGELLR
jgi:DNA-nicking Smr family endonuclease